MDVGSLSKTHDILLDAFLTHPCSLLSLGFKPALIILEAA
jgi:hypothetical protein